MAPKVLDRRVVHQGVIVRFEQVELELDHARPFTLDLVVHPGAAAVVPLDADNRVVLVRQRRHAAELALWEVPAGMRDGDEPMLACARRELAEETGLRAARWDALGAIWTAPSYCTERIALYLARELEQGPRQLDADEDIEVGRFALGEAVAMAQGGQLEDAKTVVALLRAAAHVAAST